MPKPTPPTVFNLQASDWVHCEDETGAHAELSQLTSKLVHFFLQILKVVCFAKKPSEFQNIPKNLLFIIIVKRDTPVYVYGIYLLNAMITLNFRYLKNPIRSRLFLECPQMPVYFL